MTIQIVDVTDAATFDLIPPCADARFDHRSCSYWEDADRGVKRGFGTAPSGSAPAGPVAVQPSTVFNPFAPAAERAPAFNPFVRESDPLADNPFAPRRATGPRLAADAPGKLALLVRGALVFGSYAKVMSVDGEAVAYAQFGPLSAYPRAARVRELYRQLPDAPLPAVITCIATTAAARQAGHAQALVADVCRDLADRGFAAVETYPESGRSPDETSAATPAFWRSCGFLLAVDDERFPVMRRDL